MNLGFSGMRWRNLEKHTSFVNNGDEKVWMSDVADDHHNMIVGRNPHVSKVKEQMKKIRIGQKKWKENEEMREKKEG